MERNSIIASNSLVVWPTNNLRRRTKIVFAIVLVVMIDVIEPYKIKVT